MEHIVSFFASSMKQRASKKSQGVPAGRFSEFANDRMSSCPPNLSVRPSNLCSRARSPSSPVSSCQSSASVSLPPSLNGLGEMFAESIHLGRTDGRTDQIPRTHSSLSKPDAVKHVYEICTPGRRSARWARGQGGAMMTPSLYLYSVKLPDFLANQAHSMWSKKLKDRVYHL